MRSKQIFFLLVFFANVCIGQESVLKLQSLVDSLREAGGYPGLSVSIIRNGSNPMNLVSGYADLENSVNLKSSDKMLLGSVGKTYVAAIALQLVGEGKLTLDTKISIYLGSEKWFKRLPNAEEITVEMLMNHTSGIMRYEFKPAFTKALTLNPSRNWKPEELLSFILDEKASFAAGEGWEYSDTNYILLGLIIEKITGTRYYQLLNEKILLPLRLLNTHPSDNPKLPGLIQGYAGQQNEFGGKDKVIGPDGLFIINPQFEWTGGGLYSTTEDLCRWAYELYSGKFLDSVLFGRMLKSLPSKLGPQVEYGLGVIVRNTVLGRTYGHSGFFPGYLTEVAYFPAIKLCIAVQANTSDIPRIKIPPGRCIMRLANEIALSR